MSKLRGVASKLARGEVGCRVLGLEGRMMQSFFGALVGVVNRLGFVEVQGWVVGWVVVLSLEREGGTSPE